MEESDLSPRLRVQVVLALSGDIACPEEAHHQEQAARDLGLTGAEIDVARRGSSFDRRTAAVVAYACALRQADPRQVALTRRQALVDGSTLLELSLVEQLTAYLMGMASALKAAS